jgi:hypothetical protein
MTPSAPAPVFDILPAAVPRLAGRLAEHTIRRRWRALVGPEIARRARPATLSGECLQVVVDNSPWCQELTLRAPEVLAAIAAQVGPGAVRSIRVTIGTLQPERPDGATEDIDAAGGVAVRGELEDSQIEAIESLLAPITDPEVAAVVRRLLVKATRWSRR